MTPEQLTIELRKLFVEEGNISDTKAAKLINMKQQNFSAKLKAGTLRYLEIENLLDELGYDLKWIKRAKTE